MKDKIVVKVRKTSAKTSKRRGGLPCLTSNTSARTIAAAQPPQSVIDDANDHYCFAVNGDSTTNSSSDPFHDLEMEQELAQSETFMVMTSLLNDPMRCISIPIQNAPSSSSSIYSVLPCQLHALLDNHDTEVVSRDVQQLLQDDTICKLRLSTPDSLHVLLLKSDYRRAVQSILLSMSTSTGNGTAATSAASSSSSSSSSTSMESSITWFLQQSIVDTVSEDDLTSMIQSKRSSSLSLSKVLSDLQQLQIVRACGDKSRSMYQLWLPSWGAVVTAWQKSVTRLLAHLKRSHYKERSLSSLSKSTSSPIPIPVIVEALVSQGRVVLVERPSGSFVELP